MMRILLICATRPGSGAKSAGGAWLQAATASAAAAYETRVWVRMPIMFVAPGHLAIRTTLITLGFHGDPAGLARPCRQPCGHAAGSSDRLDRRRARGRQRFHHRA